MIYACATKFNVTSFCFLVNKASPQCLDNRNRAGLKQFTRWPTCAHADILFGCLFCSNDNMKWKLSIPHNILQNLTCIDHYKSTIWINAS